MICLGPIGNVNDLPLLTIFIIHMENGGKQERLLGILVGAVGQGPGPRVMSWVYNFPSKSIKDRLLFGYRSSFECPKHILANGGEKACVSFLSLVLALSGPTGMETGRGGVPRMPDCHIGRSVGTWSPSWVRTLDL